MLRQEVLFSMAQDAERANIFIFKSFVRQNPRPTPPALPVFPDRQQAAATEPC